jgi:hypothetical protein
MACATQNRWLTLCTWSDSLPENHGLANARAIWLLVWLLLQ